MNRAGKHTLIYALSHIMVKDSATVCWEESHVGFIIPKEAENENQKEEQEAGGEEEYEEEDPENEKDRLLKTIL